MKIYLFFLVILQFKSILGDHLSGKSSKHSPKYSCNDDNHQIRIQSSNLLNSCDDLLSYYPNGCDENCCNNIPIYYLTSNYCKHSCNFCNSRNTISSTSITPIPSSITSTSTSRTTSTSITTSTSTSRTTSTSTSLNTTTISELENVLISVQTTKQSEVYNSNINSNKELNKNYFFLIGLIIPIIIALVFIYKRKKNNIVVNHDRGIINEFYNREYSEINENTNEEHFYEIPQSLENKNFSTY